MPNIPALYYAEVYGINGELYSIRDTDRERVKDWLFDMLAFVTEAHNNNRMTPQIRTQLTIFKGSNNE